jgi:hypothetical protein
MQHANMQKAWSRPNPTTEPPQKKEEGSSITVKVQPALALAGYKAIFILSLQSSLNRLCVVR